MYVNWLSMVLSGLRGLENFNADTKKWNQAHSQARYVILRVLLEGAKELIDIKHVTNKEDGKPDLLVTVNRFVSSAQPQLVELWVTICGFRGDSTVRSLLQDRDRNDRKEGYRRFLTETASVQGHG